jgi:hypothetical protein
MSLRSTWLAISPIARVANGRLCLFVSRIYATVCRAMRGPGRTAGRVGFCPGDGVERGTAVQWGRSLVVSCTDGRADRRRVGQASAVSSPPPKKPKKPGSGDGVGARASGPAAVPCAVASVRIKARMERSGVRRKPRALYTRCTRSGRVVRSGDDLVMVSGAASSALAVLLAS